MFGFARQCVVLRRSGCSERPHLAEAAAPPPAALAGTDGSGAIDPLRARASIADDRGPPGTANGLGCGADITEDVLQAHARYPGPPHLAYGAKRFSKMIQAGSVSKPSSRRPPALLSTVSRSQLPGA